MPYWKGSFGLSVQHLRNGDDFFEMEFVSEQEDKGIWRVKGSRIPKKRDMVAGIITPDRNREQKAYYLTPAARDARNPVC